MSLITQHEWYKERQKEIANSNKRDSELDCVNAFAEDERSLNKVGLSKGLCNQPGSIPGYRAINSICDRTLSADTPPKRICLLSANGQYMRLVNSGY